MAAERIRSGGADIILAGGAESMSLVPMSGHKFAPNPWMVDHIPQIYMGMGLTAEEVYRKYNISREEQDAFAYRSHQNALKAQAEGKFDDEIVPIEVDTTTLSNGKPSTQESVFKKDEGPRADTSVEALGEAAAGISRGRHGDGRQFIADQRRRGGGDRHVGQEGARAGTQADGSIRQLRASAGVPPEIMGIGPVVAIPKALKLAGLKLDDIGVVELNEAFAVQALAVVREAGLNMDTLNVNGGAIALGHPLGCTGAKLTATILREMQRRNVRYGMVTMCIGGGQGAAGIFERLN